MEKEVLGEPSPIPDGHPESMISEQEINELMQWLVEPCKGNKSYDLPSCTYTPESEQELNDMVQWLIEPCKGNESNGLPSCTYAPDCSEQEINQIMQWLLEPCQGPEIPACSPECPSSLELPPAKTWAVPSETEQVQEVSAEPADQKKRGQGRKRKSEDETQPKKRCRTEPNESCNMANPPTVPQQASLLTVPQPANLYTVPHQANLNNLYTVPHQTYLPTVPHLTNPASSEGRKRKLEGEKLPKKRFRRDLMESCGMANLHPVPHQANLVTVPHHVIMPTLPHQANFANLPTVPYLTHLPPVPHQVNLANLPTVPHQANPVSNTSTPVPPLQTVIPNYVITYTEVGSKEQRERYVQDCRAAFHEANILYCQIGQYLGQLLSLDRQLKQLVPGSESYKELCDLINKKFQAVVQVRPSYTNEANRFLYLDGMQKHIFRLVAQFDQSCGQSGF